MIEIRLRASILADFEGLALVDNCS